MCVWRLRDRSSACDLAWHGANHSPDNIIIHLPDHDTLMLIDIVNENRLVNLWSTSALAPLLSAGADGDSTVSSAGGHSRRAWPTW